MVGKLRAIHYSDKDRHREKQHPGSVYFNEGAMRFYCPCGCGQLCRIPVGENVKPQADPSWQWNGSTRAPTLQPSVKNSANGVCNGWHGWLRDGYWEAC